MLLVCPSKHLFSDCQVKWRFRTCHNSQPQR